MSYAKPGVAGVCRSLRYVGEGWVAVSRYMVVWVDLRTGRTRVYREATTFSWRWRCPFNLYTTARRIPPKFQVVCPPKRGWVTAILVFIARKYSTEWGRGQVPRNLNFHRHGLLADTEYTGWKTIAYEGVSADSPVMVRRMLRGLFLGRAYIHPGLERQLVQGSRTLTSRFEGKLLSTWKSEEKQKISGRSREGASQVLR